MYLTHTSQAEPTKSKKDAPNSTIMYDDPLAKNVPRQLCCLPRIPAEFIYTHREVRYGPAMNEPYLLKTMGMPFDIFIESSQKIYYHSTSVLGPILHRDKNFFAECKQYLLGFKK
jgi:hypothetical protein